MNHISIDPSWWGDLKVVADSMQSMTENTIHLIITSVSVFLQLHLLDSDPKKIPGHEKSSSKIGGKKRMFSL